MIKNPRKIIEDLIIQDNLKGLIDKAAEIHGHYCPGLALGVKASYIACKRLDIVHTNGMEKIMAIVECNNCFVDGIQVISGCTLGNNALVYKDLGKTAVTFHRRGENTGLRLVAKNLSNWKKRAYRILELPEDEIFKLDTVEISPIEYAPIFNSVECSVCGENVMETRIRMREYKPICISCANEDYWMIDGKGIHLG